MLCWACKPESEFDTESPVTENDSEALTVLIEHLNQLNVRAQQERPGAPEGAAAHAPPLVFPLWIRKESKKATVHTGAKIQETADIIAPGSVNWESFKSVMHGTP